MRIRASIGEYQHFRRCTSCNSNTHKPLSAPCPKCGELALTGIVARWITLDYLTVFHWVRSYASLLVAKGDVLVMDADNATEIVVEGKIYRGSRTTYSVMRESEAYTYLDNLPA